MSGLLLTGRTPKIQKWLVSITVPTDATGQLMYVVYSQKAKIFICKVIYKTTRTSGCQIRRRCKKTATGSKWKAFTCAGCFCTEGRRSQRWRCLSGLGWISTRSTSPPSLIVVLLLLTMRMMKMAMVAAPGPLPLSSLTIPHILKKQTKTHL